MTLKIMHTNEKGFADAKPLLLSVYLDHYLLIVSCSACSHNNSDSFSDTTLLADDTTHIVGCNVQVINDDAFLVRLVNDYLDSVLVLNEFGNNSLK